MPRGGNRTGSGRKPRENGERVAQGVILGMDGARRVHRAPELPSAPPKDDQTRLLEPPADDELPVALSGDAKRWWRAWAPKALERKTLTAVEIPGFAELCLRQARVAALDIRIEQLGPSSQEALDYLRERRAISKDLNTSLKDFKLTAFGKPVVTERAAPAANPFGQVAR